MEKFFEKIDITPWDEDMEWGDGKSRTLIFQNYFHSERWISPIYLSLCRTAIGAKTKGSQVCQQFNPNCEFNFEVGKRGDDNICDRK